MADLPIVRSPAAEDDLVDIWCPIALENPRAADRLLDTIGDPILQLAMFPDSGPRRPDIAPDARIDRRQLSGALSPCPTKVEILRGVHVARDPATLS